MAREWLWLVGTFAAGVLLMSLGGARFVGFSTVQGYLYSLRDGYWSAWGPVFGLTGLVFGTRMTLWALKEIRTSDKS